MSPADFAAMSGNDGFGGGGGNWLAMIFLFSLIFGFGGNGWGNNSFANAIGYENLATSAEVQRGFDNQNSMANEREILAAVNGNSLQGMQNANQNTQYLMGAFNDKYNELQRDIAGVAIQNQQLLANQNECCCSTRLLVSETAAQQRYDSAMQTAQLQQAIQAEGAATRGLIQQNKIEALQQKVAALENGLQTQQLQSDIAAATAGVVRYPNGWTYNAGPSPFCGCGNGVYNI